jgi:hypothetical protein
MLQFIEYRQEGKRQVYIVFFPPCNPNGKAISNLTSLEKLNQPLAEKSFTPCWTNCLAPLALLEK